MPLSEHEQRILEQLERDLATEDPKLATTMTSGPTSSATRIIVGVLGVIVGLVLLFIGVAQSLAVVGIIGFVIMVLAVLYAVATPKKTTLTLVDQEGNTLHSGTRSRKLGKAAKQSFTARMEERWEKRNRGDQF